MLFKVKLLWLKKLVKLITINFEYIFDFWSNFNIVTISIAKPDLKKSFMVRAIIEKSSLKKDFIIKTILKKYCNLKHVS